MSRADLAVSIITYHRSELFDSCLKSLQNAMTKEKHPIYIIIQDATEDDLDVLRKYEHLISEIVHTQGDGLNVETSINKNRILAWEFPLIQRGHQYVICLEDDVEVSADIFEFTEKVLEQNSKSKHFRGINFGSFEKYEEPGSYSRLRFGLHGPASLISRRSLQEFQLKTLQKFAGAIPWDAWIEPVVKRGFVITSNVARYKDNGQNGTHATAANHSEYFQKLNESFFYGEKTLANGYLNMDIEHTWRSDCLIYKKTFLPDRYLKYLAIRIYQVTKAFRKTLRG